VLIAKFVSVPRKRQSCWLSLWYCSRLLGDTHDRGHWDQLFVYLMALLTMLHRVVEYFINKALGEMSKEAVVSFLTVGWLSFGGSEANNKTEGIVGFGSPIWIRDLWNANECYRPRRALRNLQDEKSHELCNVPIKNWHHKFELADRLPCTSSWYMCPVTRLILFQCRRCTLYSPLWRNGYRVKIRIVSVVCLKMRSRKLSGGTNYIAPAFVWIVSA
jgi:hypothetical protein